MSANTQIEWTDYTWNFIAAYRGNVRGWFCTKRTKACANCYAEAINLRLGNGLEYLPKNLDKVEFRVMTDMLQDPLRWRQPRKVFVNSMTDFFHPAIPDWMRRIGFAVMMATPRNWYQILTKQPEQMEKFFNNNTPEDCLAETERIAPPLYPILADAIKGLECERNIIDLPPLQWPLRNVALCVSVGDQADADAFIPILLRVPADIRGLSLEPLLGPVDLACRLYTHATGVPGCAERLIDWLIIGGESGKKARPCNLEWIRSLVRQGQSAGVPVFVKQLGKRPYWPIKEGEVITIKDSKGGNINEWPADLRVRQFPK